MKTLLLIAHMLLQPCPTEDSMNCYWDAQMMGNQQGSDFADIMGWMIR